MERMGRLRRSLRDSFRKKREAPESSKPHQWQADEEAVRGGNSSFHVKYLGSVEVFESRGMPVCEEAMKVLRQSRRRPVKSILHVSGDGLRLVEDETKGLILDQTIEKVSFCAPDRNHERGFSYICRDGTTRRWMCHGFLSTKDSGERLSHAVGCAFAACLERKQKREKECGVSMTYDSKTSTFTRSGSFRTNSMTDSISSNSGSPPPGDNIGAIIRSSTSANTHAIERPHAPAKMLERQGSFRGFTQLANHSPFKRQLSLRLNDLPSNLQRTQQPNEIPDVFASISNGSSVSANTSPAPPPRTQRNRLNSLPNNSFGGNEPEPSGGLNGNRGDSGPNLMRLDSKDLVTELCQQVTQGLSLLAANHDENGERIVTSSRPAGKFTNPWNDDTGKAEAPAPPTTFAPIPNLDKSSNINQSNFTPTQIAAVDNNWIQNIPGQFTFKSTSSSKVWTQPISSSSSSPSKLPISVTKIKENVPVTSTTRSGSITETQTKSQTGSRLIKQSSVTTSIAGTGTIPTSLPEVPVANVPVADVPPTSGATRPQLVSAMSVQQPPSFRQGPTYRSLTTTGRSQSLGADPFDASWANSAARTGQTPTNPFARQPQQTFQISM